MSHHLKQLTSGLAAIVALVSLPRAEAANSTIDSLTGQVTANEISTFKTAAFLETCGDSNGGNNFAYGGDGDLMEACGEMYDLTKDRTILDKMITFCDKVISVRNTTKVMWTGLADPVWQNNSSNTTWGCEQGDVAGHLAYAAQLIAQNSAIWNLTVGGGDPYGYGTTYKARATKYLQVSDQTVDLFYTNGFIHADEFMQTPPSPPWPDPNSANDPTPWNQQYMLCSPMVRGADAHALFNDGSSKITKYRNTAKASIQRFQTQCDVFTYTKNSKTVCKWSYAGNTFQPGDAIRYTEDCAHGGYDISAFLRARCYLFGAVDDAHGLMLADTLMEVIKSGTQFFKRVDGTDGLQNSMKNSWSYLARWRSDAFAATTKIGAQSYADAAKKLWIKHCMTNGWPVAVGQATTYQAESLTVSSTSGESVTTNTDGGSGGAYVQITSNGVNDQITFTLPNISPGNYVVAVGWKRQTNRAIVQTLVGSAGGTLGNQGSTIDMYGSSGFYVTTLSGTWNIGSTGNKSVQFKVTGKNASSSGYNIAIDYIKLTPQ